MDAIIFEVVKTLLIGAIGVIIKMYKDVTKLKGDVRIAFTKIRALEKENDRHSFKNYDRTSNETDD